MSQLNTSDRISLRLTTPPDMDFVIQMERKPENKPFIRQWSLEQHLAAIDSPHYAHLIIEDERKKRIGYIILAGLDSPDKSIEFKRIVIREKEKGFGQLAIHALKKVVFEEFSAHRLWLEVMETNCRARRVYESLGFVKEGVHRESVKQDDRFLNLTVMSILSHEYERSTRTAG